MKFFSAAVYSLGHSHNHPVMTVNTGWVPLTVPFPDLTVKLSVLVGITPSCSPTAIAGSPLDHFQQSCEDRLPYHKKKWNLGLCKVVFETNFWALSQLQGALLVCDFHWFSLLTSYLIYSWTCLSSWSYQSSLHCTTPESSLFSVMSLGLKFFTFCLFQKS